MRERFRGIPQRVEAFRQNHPLRPPTKAEMMLGAGLLSDVALISGLAIYEKVSGNSTWPWLDIDLALNLMGGIGLLAQSITSIRPRAQRDLLNSTP